MQKQSSPPDVFSQREGILKMCWWFSGAFLSTGVILIMLQSGFVEIVLLRWCPPVVSLPVWGRGHLFWRTALEDCFLTEMILYTIFNLFFLMKYTFEDFSSFVILISFYQLLCWFLFDASLDFINLTKLL